MEETVTAIYENGVLRPLAPLNLAEHTRVRYTPGAEYRRAAPRGAATGFACHPRSFRRGSAERGGPTHCSLTR